ncbi:MAG: DNA repair exonuclease [Rhodothermales bacterium]
MHTFLHLADIHLDASFICRSHSMREQLRSELLASLQRAVDYAIRERVLAVFIVGDLLEAEHLSVETEQFLLEQCRRLDEAHIPCVYVAGDRDPGSHLARAYAMAWPESFIYISANQPRVIELQDVDGTPIVRLVGAGHEAGSEGANLISAYPAAKSEIPTFGLLHGTVEGARGTGSEPRTAQTAAASLKRLNYAYWALGHMNASQQVKDVPNAWYPGSLMGRSAEETGLHGGLLVSLDEDGEIQVAFKSFSRVEWVQLTIDALVDVQDFNTLAQRVEKAFNAAIAADESIHMRLVQVRLEGPCPMADALRNESQREMIEEKLARYLNVNEVEMLTEWVSPSVDVDSYRDEPHLLGELIGMINQLREAPESLEGLAPASLAGLQGESAERRQYVMSLLRDIESEAVVRLLQDNRHAH